MDQDSIRSDSLDVRPLPKWLMDQKSGLNTLKPEKIIMKEDNSLQVSFAVTGLLIFVVIAVLTFYIMRRNNRKPI